MCVSDTDGAIFTYIWKIENFEYCSEKKGQPLYSPEFEISARNKSRWRLVLYPRGDIYKASFIPCFLKRVGNGSEEPNKITIAFSIGLITGNETLLENQKVNTYYFKINGIFGLYDFVKREEIFKNRRKFLFNEALCVSCQIWENNPKLSVEHELWFARTRMDFEQKKFIWVIDNFESTIINQSPNVFFVDFRWQTIPPLSFQLCCLSNGNIKLDIRQINSRLKVFVKCKVKVAAIKQSYLEDEYWFDVQTDEQVWHFPLLITKEKFIKMKRESSWNDVLKLQCECTISTGVGHNRIERTEKGIPFTKMTQHTDTETEVTEKQVQEIKNSKCESTECDTQNSRGNQSFFQNKLTFFNSSNSLQDDLQFLYQDKILCDITLQSGRDVFQVHKTILTARSPVFRAMFKSGMEETKTDAVQVDDIDTDTLRRMLLFMYTDKTEEMKWECASNLYVAADKYEILPLKKKCSNVLKHNLSTTNVCEVLVLADMHQDCDLKQVVQNFILLHDKEIFCSDSWNKFEANNVQLAVQTMKHIYLKKLDA